MVPLTSSRDLKHPTLQPSWQAQLRKQQPHPKGLSAVGGNPTSFHTQQALAVASTHWPEGETHPNVQQGHEILLSGQPMGLQGLEVEMHMSTSMQHKKIPLLDAQVAGEQLETGARHSFHIGNRG